MELGVPVEIRDTRKNSNAGHFSTYGLTAHVMKATEQYFPADTRFLMQLLLHFTANPHSTNCEKTGTRKGLCDCLSRRMDIAPMNRRFSKMAAENSNKIKLKTYTSTRKSTFTLVTLQSFSISGVISAEKIS